MAAVAKRWPKRAACRPARLSRAVGPCRICSQALHSTALQAAPKPHPSAFERPLERMHDMQGGLLVTLPGAVAQ